MRSQSTVHHKVQFYTKLEEIERTGHLQPIQKEEWRKKKKEKKDVNKLLAGGLVFTTKCY